MAVEFQPFHYGKAEEPKPVDLVNVTGSAVVGLGILTLAIEVISPAQTKQFLIPAGYFLLGAVIFGIPKLKR